MQFDIVARVLHFSQALQNGALRHGGALAQVQNHTVISIHVAQTVNRRNRGDDNDVLAFQQCLGGRQTHLLDLLVDRGVFLYISIRRRHVGLRLVVIVIRDKIFHGVARKEIAEFSV